jgi:hypothetical protein
VEIRGGIASLTNQPLEIMSDRKTISADKARSGERVTVDFNEGGYGIAFEVDGTFYSPPGNSDTATEMADDLGSGLNESPDGRAWDRVRNSGNYM